MSEDIDRFKQFLNGDNVIRHLRRYYEHMPTTDDIIVSILKGHLLIEEKLLELIATCVKKPRALKDSRLTFYQALCLTESLHWHRDSDWVWSSLRVLNGIRNSLSHELQSVKTDKQVEEFLGIVETRYPPDAKKYVRKRKDKRILTSIGTVYAYLAAYLEACRNSKELREKEGLVQ